MLELQQQGRQAIFGDATKYEILRNAGLTSGAYLIVTIPNAEVSFRIIQAAREVALLQTTGAAAGFVATLISRATAGTTVLFLNLFVMIYAMFFFLKDGKKIMRVILNYVPMNDTDKRRLVRQLTFIPRASVKGTLLIGIIQGAFDGVAFWLAGLEGSAFWATLMAILSVLPAVGAPVVWIPASLYLVLSGRVAAGLVLAGWCATVLAIVEYVVRPIVVATDIKMPDLLVLISTLGGLCLFGPIGFIAGPIVCGLFLTIWQIYGETFGVSAAEKHARHDSLR